MKIIILLIGFLVLHDNFLFSQSCDSISISARVQTQLPSCNSSNGTIRLINTSGGVSPYTYYFGNQINLSGSFDELDIGTYPIIIEDANFCQDTLIVELQYRDASSIISPDNAFTPNDDGINDRWTISGIANYQEAQVKVFNKWGQLIHQNTNYSNENGWNGKQNGSELPAATYFYVIRVFVNCEEAYLNGTVTIIR